MRFLVATVLVLFTLVCLPLAGWLASLNDVAAPAMAHAEEGASELWSRLAVLIAAAPATLVVGPVVAWTGFALKRSIVTWIGFGLVAVHALAIVETIRALGGACESLATCVIA